MLTVEKVLTSRRISMSRFGNLRKSQWLKKFALLLAPKIPASESSLMFNAKSKRGVYHVAAFAVGI
jgi:hypothetical protein